VLVELGHVLLQQEHEDVWRTSFCTVAATTYTRSTFGRFVQALEDRGSAPFALVIAEATEADQQGSLEAYKAIFADLGVEAARVKPVFVSPTAPLTRLMFERLQRCGVFVRGGATPYYQQALCADPAWTTYLANVNVPYGGTSAGAAVAARQAIVGGWQAQRGDVVRPMLFRGASEGLDLITVQHGLNLVPFAVDVHAS
jgi:cyanophycinase